MLRQAARRCAQARRTLARPLAPSRARLHSSTGSSRSNITSRDVFLGTTAAAVGFGIWRYFAGPSNVHLDAEDAPIIPKTKQLSRESDSVPPEDSSEKATTAHESADFATTSTSAHELVETKEHETQASDVGEISETSPVVEGEEGASTGAFNPVTGEINWDCPCLGGMAHGPCGPEFREAFSCFVYSEEEPKGINCVEKFRAMQDCFRAHPDVYGEEIMRDDDEEDMQGVTPPEQEKAPDAETASSDSTPSTSSPSS